MSLNSNSIDVGATIVMDTVHTLPCHVEHQGVVPGLSTYFQPAKGIWS